MSRRTARGNRLGLALVGAALLLAGVAGLIRGLGWWPGVFGAAQSGVTEQSSRFAAEQGDWFWPVLAAVLVLIGLLALRWLLVQARTGSVRTLRLEQDSRRGTTTVPARVVTAALTADLADGVPLRRVNAGLTGSPTRPRLHLSAALPAGADPVSARARIGEALWRQRRALEVDRLPTVVTMRGS